MTVSAAARIEYSELEVGYGSEAIVGPFSGVFEEGQLQLLTGPNGGGKTTLLRTILGLLAPVGGRVTGIADRSTSYVPQLGALDLGFPVNCLEVVGTGLPPKVGRAERRTRGLQALETMGLSNLRSQPFAQLSGGQRQRVLVARALCADAQFIALDEPTAGVDARSSEVVWQTLRELAGQGRTILAVTHDLFLAPKFADRLLVLDQGGLEVRQPTSLDPFEPST